MNGYVPTANELKTIVEDSIVDRYTDYWGAISAAAHICPDQEQQIALGTDIDVIGLVLNHEWDVDHWLVIIPDDATSADDIWADYQGDHPGCDCQDYKLLLAEQHEEGPLSPCCNDVIATGPEGGNRCGNCKQRVETGNAASREEQ